LFLLPYSVDMSVRILLLFLLPLILLLVLDRLCPLADDRGLEVWGPRDNGRDGRENNQLCGARDCRICDMRPVGLQMHLLIVSLLRPHVPGLIGWRPRLTLLSWRCYTWQD
jgi:hypothetical protein